ncbi:UNVERIFIED_CONTAM: hypothetical protein FKN15_010851 [Acipenser sinensis]
MEETVRNLLQNQGALDQTAVDTVDIMKVYKGKLSEGVKKPKEVVEDLNLAAEVDYPSEGSGNEEEKDKTTLLLERLRALEAENSALTTENETQREQYERCLDEDLREECLKLRTRVFDLEQQNRTLSVLFQQRVRPASDLLLQKLHSRIMDLSARDLLSEPERSKSFLQLRTTETDIHEFKQNVKSEIPVFKCQSQLGLTVPTQLYPRSSCSSSELSLSSACSEYSSSSYTWNDGKLCSKRSSLNWEKRVSIGSSAPNVSSPAEEQLPTRKKESHILEGLKKLQKRTSMEPPSLISKWGYKDCMNSNEGIYSPGIKCVGRGAPKSHLPNKPVGMCMSRELGKKIANDYDSHDDADDERHMEPVDYGEPPTRDRNCDPGQAELRSPSPPPPPGRSTSLLIRLNYENTPPLALKPGTHISTSNASRRGSAALLRHHNQPPQLDVQHQSPQMMQDTAELDVSHCAEPAPQKLVDNVTQQLQSSPGAHQTPTKGSPKRFSVKMYHPSSTSGHAQGVNEPIAKSSKNISCLYNPQKGSSLQSTFTSKKGISSENGLPLQYKTSSSLPISLQGHSQSTIEPHGTQGHGSQVTPTSPGAESSLQNTEEKVVKTRIPIGLKVLVKSPPVLRKSITVPGKQEKDHINTASKGTVTSNNFRQCDALQGTRCFEMVTAKSDQEIRSDIQESYLNKETLSPVLNDSESPVADKGDGESRLFKRSVSVTNKPHLMPALGMNGAKARSQSFSAHTGDKTCTSVTEGPGKIRTQIITNTTGRGSSLPGQNSSIEGFQLTPVSRPSESPSRSPRGVDHSHTRQSSYGGMSSSSSHQGSPSKVASRTTPKADGPQNGSKYEGNKSPPQKEARSLPLADRLGLRNSRQPGKSQPQFDSVSPSHFLPEQASKSIGSRLLNPSRIEIMRPAKKSDNPTKGPEVPEKLSPSVSTIEEKVMMGIQENMQKGQEKEKSQVTETKLKTGSSLASWFGFRRNKLPALSSKKAETSKAKEEKKEVKIGSVLGNKQLKSDKKKDKKNEQCKDSQGHTTKPENNDKVVSIMDHCNSKIGPPMKQLQPSTTKDQFMKELLNRSMSKGSSQDSSLPTISISTQGSHKKNSEMKADMEMHNETVTKIVTQKINIMADDDEETIPKPSCQDHMLGSSCQMRTLDSGIGTFPLPDSVTRATGKHLPKSQSNPEKVVTVSPEPDEILPQITLPKAKTLEREMPSTSETCQQEPGAVCHSLSDPTMAAKAGHTFQSRLPMSTTSGIMKPKGVCVKKLNPVSAKSPDSDEKQAEKRKNSQDQSSLQTDRTLLESTYSASSSDSENESEYESNEIGTGQEVLLDQMKNNTQVDQDEHAVKKSCIVSPMSIMDFYQHKVYVHYGKEGHKDMSQYSFVHNQSITEGKAGDSPSKLKQVEEKKEEPKMSGFAKMSLESLNKLNSNSSPFLEKEKKSLNKAEGEKADDAGNEEDCSGCSVKPGVDNLASLSDSLYDSFSSCASQGSSDI